MLKKLNPVVWVTIFNILIIFSYTTTQAATDCHGQQILTASSCVGDDVDTEEAKLHRLVNEYRAQHGLPAIPLSSSLSLVANRHVFDLVDNISSYSRSGSNWLHGWSDCAYDAGNLDTYPCMWEAPQRFGTSYTGSGYENLCGGPEYPDYVMTADYALECWQGSSAHNAVILNQGMWQDKPWNALGVGIYEGYAVLWFGKENDPVGTPDIPDSTGDTTTPPVTDTTDSSELVWHTSKTEALAQAQSENKLLLVFAGRMTCGNCQHMRYTVLESTSPAIKPLLQKHFVLWFADIDGSEGWSSYATGLDTFGIPLIAIVDPNDSENYLERTTGVQEAEVMYALLENSVQATQITPSVTDTSVFAPFAGKTWIFNSEKGLDEITFNATPIDSIFLGLDTKNQLWRVDYVAESNTYVVFRAEEIAGKLNYITYKFTCDDCVNMSGQFFIIYDFEGSAQTVDGPYPADGKVKSVAVEQPDSTPSDGFSLGNVVVSNIQLSPPPPATLYIGGDKVHIDDLNADEKVEISFDYSIISPSICTYIWMADPYSNGERVPAGIAPSSCETGNGKGRGFFTPMEGSRGAVVNELRFTMRDLEEGEKFEEGEEYFYFYTLPANYTIAQRASENSYPTLGNKAVDKFNNPLNANSTLNGGISVNGGGYVQRVEQNLSDPVDVTGTITVDPVHVGNTVNIFVYAKATLPTMEAYFMLGENFEILAWDLNPTNLVAFQKNVPLLPVQAVAMYNGNFIYPGTLDIFFGYQLADGTLVSNSTPIEVAIYADSCLRVKRPNSPEEQLFNFSFINSQ